MWNHDSPGNFLSNYGSVDINSNISSYELGLSCTLHAKKKTNGKVKYLLSDSFFFLQVYFLTKVLQNHLNPFCQGNCCLQDQEIVFT